MGEGARRYWYSRRKYIEATKFRAVGGGGEPLKSRSRSKQITREVEDVAERRDVCEEPCTREHFCSRAASSRYFLLSRGQAEGSGARESRREAEGGAPP